MSIASGPPFRVGPIEVRGVRRYTAEMVRDYATLRRGDPYELADLDQYVRTHTVLLEQVLSPVVGALFGTPASGPGAFWSHLEKAHLEASPAEQVADVVDLDQYVVTHTVLIEDLLSPVVGDC